MRAEVVLTPAESKRLIAKAVIKMDSVQDALRKGIVVISVGTTCLCILEELMQRKLRPPEEYLCGIIIPGKMCVSPGMRLMIQTHKHASVWVFEKGQLITEITLREVLPRMTSSDVFIKGANALDPARKAGVLLAGLTGGTTGLALPAIYARGINLIVPVGLEKMIPTPIETAAKEAGIKRIDYSMGLSVGLIPLPGTIVTEIEAIEILTGAQAIPIAAGGINRAEGSVVLVVNGSKEQVQQTISLLSSISDEKSPEFQPASCEDCALTEGEVVCPHAVQKVKTD